MKKALVFLSLLALAIALPAGAQTSMQKVNRMTVVKARPGMSTQWEAGLKKLNVWVRQHNLPLTHYCWSIISGPRSGQYVVGVTSHKWADFDTADKAGQGVGAQIVADLEPYTESHVTSYWTYREDLSEHPENTRPAPAAFFDVTTFYLKIGGEQSVEDAIKASVAAAQKAHWQGNPSGWYSLVNGGYGSELAIVTAHQNWADFQPPAKTFFGMLSDVLGHEGFAALGKQFNSGVRGVRTEIWRYRPDLSYVAAK